MIIYESDPGYFQKLFSHPSHKLFPKIKILKTESFEFDRRLFANEEEQ